jgi:Peptidase family M1 domain
MLLAASGVAALSTALSGCPAPSALPPPPADRPTYALTVAIASNRKVVRGTSRISFALDRATDRIVLRLWPNIPAQRRAGARLVVRNVRVGNAAATTSTPDPTTLIVARPVAAGERVTVTMSWTLQLPRSPTERLASLLGVRLSSFFPLLAWDGTDWALDPPAPQLETWTTPVADFDVRITTPKGMQVFASGASVGKGRWRAVAVRDFAIEAGKFDVVRRVVRVPSPVVLRVVAASVFHGVPSPFVDAAVRALTLFSERYGAYPWSTYTVVVEADRPQLGEEYPTIVFVSPDLGADVVTHETAHQWFYSLVGDDQARDPWLDESLAQWATARVWDEVEEEASAEIPVEVQNLLGEPMTFWGPLPFMPTVWDGLYLQGVKALTSLGDDDGVDCALQRYVHDNAYGIARPRDLLAALSPVFPSAETVLSGFGARF